MGGHFDILYWVLIVMFYFIPYMLWWLHTNDEEKLLAAFLYNLFLGWTGLFWLLSLYVLYLERRGRYLWGGPPSSPLPSTSENIVSGTGMHGQVEKGSEPPIIDWSKYRRRGKPKNLILNPKTLGAVIGLIVVVKAKTLTSSDVAIVLGLVAGFAAFLGLKMIAGLFSKFAKNK